MPDFHCWYSRSWDAQYGHIIYEIDSKEVKVTNAHSSRASTFNPVDSVYLGIGHFVKSTDKHERTLAEIRNTGFPSGSPEDIKEICRRMKNLRQPIAN